ncbi:MAG: hypothetical protein V4703_12805 [Actinomycetota bacterium]
MTLALIPEADALIAGWLRGHPDVIALDANVAGTLPDTIVKSWIRVTLLDGRDDERCRVEHLVDFMVQLDCYAGRDSTREGEGQGEASTLARTARAVLKAAEGATVAGVVVTRVRFTGHIRVPDTDMEPARERYIVTAEVMLHRAA